MKKRNLAVAFAAAGTLTGLVVPSSANALSESSNPSCAALWAHLQQDGIVPGPLGIGNKAVGKGFAASIAHEKLDGYCCA